MSEELGFPLTHVFIPQDHHRYAFYVEHNKARDQIVLVISARSEDFKRNILTTEGWKEYAIGESCEGITFPATDFWRDIERRMNRDDTAELKKENQMLRDNLDDLRKVLDVIRK